MKPTLKVNEIFKSIQGESTFAGLPCVFVRLAGCNLRCTYCDTAYAYSEGQEWSVPDLITEIAGYGCKLVEITGGEPLLQSETFDFARKLILQNFNVLIETNGSVDISALDKGVVVIMDVKCPGSGMSMKNFWKNIDFLKQNDEVKFVIGSRMDFLWAESKIMEFNLIHRCKVLFSAVYGKLEPYELTEWILKENLEVRFQLQLQKYIWDSDRRGV